jgi:hypothetical protein
MINFGPFYCLYYRRVEFMKNKPFCIHSCLYTFGFRIGAALEQNLASVRSKPKGGEREKDDKI